MPAPDHLSTFALDVDTASYGYARRTLAEGRLPAPATVRPEEFVDSFRPDHPRPKDRVHEVVDSLAMSSSTNVEAGVRTGHDIAVEGHRKGAANRVVLLSDALADTGDTEADAILARVDEERREYGITLFGVGVGAGVGSECGDAFMERLADEGDGQTAYVSTPAQARKVFVDQLPSPVELRARDAEAQVAFDRRTVEEFRLVGYENRAVADDDFRNDRVDGGEIGAGHTVTALCAVKTRPGAAGPLATATVRRLDPATRAPHERSGTLGTAAPTGDVRDDGHDSLQLTAIAACFADALRGGCPRGDAPPGAPGLAALARRAGAIAGRSGSAVVTELADAIREASGLLDSGEGEVPYGEGGSKSGDPYS
ncbi:hypothetical protein GCM10010275_23590 [Streptomyces litmocidini]|nr:hypothetical protein GCM10010275_23590 [Streptomyces litmocidini]